MDARVCLLSRVSFRLELRQDGSGPDASTSSTVRRCKDYDCAVEYSLRLRLCHRAPVAAAGRGRFCNAGMPPHGGFDQRWAAQSARQRLGPLPAKHGERQRRRRVTASTLWDVTVTMWTAGAPTGQRAQVGR